jgi:hypothetical protein
MDRQSLEVRRTCICVISAYNILNTSSMRDIKVCVPNIYVKKIQKHTTDGNLSYDGQIS